MVELAHIAEGMSLVSDMVRILPFFVVFLILNLKHP